MRECEGPRVEGGGVLSLGEARAHPLCTGVSNGFEDLTSNRITPWSTELLFGCVERILYEASKVLTDLGGSSQTFHRRAHL